MCAVTDTKRTCVGMDWTAYKYVSPADRHSYMVSMVVMSECRQASKPASKQ